MSYLKKFLASTISGRDQQCDHEWEQLDEKRIVCPKCDALRLSNIDLAPQLRWVGEAPSPIADEALFQAHDEWLREWTVAHAESEPECREVDYPCSECVHRDKCHPTSEEIPF